MKYIIILLLLLINTAIFAVGRIVYDPEETTAITTQTSEELDSLSQQINQLKAQYQELKITYQEAKNIDHNATGHYGFGSLFNSPNNWQQLEWTANSWEATLHALSGGNPVRYQQLLTHYKEYHPYLTPSQYAQGASAPQVQNYEENVATNATAMSQASYEYNNLNQLYNEINQLSQQIESAKNLDTKSAIDLNSRLIEMVATIQMEQLKMQTLANEQMAQSNASTISYDTQQAKFDAVPPEGGN